MRYVAEDAIGILGKFFRRTARRLYPLDEHEREDIVQEMALACLGVQDEHALSYFKARAVWRALDYMRRDPRLSPPTQAGRASRPAHQFTSNDELGAFAASLYASQEELEN
jgi:hypothetical protein